MNFPQIIEKDNLGGNLYFYFAPISSIYAISFPINGTITSEIEFFENTGWQSGYSTYNQLSFTSEPVADPYGGYFNTVIKGFYPQPTAVFLNYLTSMLNMKFIVLIKDSNNRNRIVGSVKQPASFTFKESVGPLASDLPGIAFEFSCESYLQPFFYAIDLSAPQIDPEE